MNIFIAGICGTFMAGIAQLAQSAKHSVSGCDQNVYPPMSTLLESKGIEIRQGYEPTHIDGDVDQVIIGNALSRGNPLVEWVLNHGIGFQSGPQWLHDHVLIQRQVVAVAGTHGKTSTSSMIAWTLQSNEQSPGFLIGGKPGNFDGSAQLGSGDYFVIEADEYDTAFFDKRSKFVHYSPNIAILNNLEFDHADIFSDLSEIKTQFHHLVRIIPQNGHIIVNHDDTNLSEVLKKVIGAPFIRFHSCPGIANGMPSQNPGDCSQFDVYHHGKKAGSVRWNCIGTHNMQNALAAIAAAFLCDISIEASCQSLGEFIATDRRLQLLANIDTVSLYEDFAHHPTAIAYTIDAIKAKYPNRRIVAIVEPRSNTMRSGCHINELGTALDVADDAIIYQPEGQSWDANDITTKAALSVCSTSCDVLERINLSALDNSVIICMSNGSFDGIPLALKNQLEGL